MIKKLSFSLLFGLLVSSFTWSQDILMQNGTVSQCSGTFYDSGGEFGNYGNNENLVITICPENPGQRIQLDFTEFNTQLNLDVMTIYDGDSTAANAFGTFTGANSPGFVQATPGNTSGCLTIEFVSDGAGNTTGWVADVMCLTPCQTINAQLDSAVPAPNGDGYIRVCPNEDITLTGSGTFSVDGTGATYEWDLGDGNTAAGQTVTFSYPNPGVYIVNLNIRDTNTSEDPLGCTNNNLINQVVQVATEPDFTGTQATDSVICYGESTDITGVVQPTPFINDCTPPVADQTFLPDGSGAVYSSFVPVDCFDSSATITDASQIVSICLNMEHSFLGDLEIIIVSPNGQQAVLKDYPGGGGTYLGGANDDGSNAPGVGADYCFSMSGAVTLVNGPTINAGTPPSASIAPGTYLPEESFANLIGSPLNGDWEIIVVDNLAIDNGYIFSWEIEFDPNLQPPELSFTPAITSEAWDADPTITNTAGNVITVTPPSDGQYCYTYRVTDDFGCEYTEEVCIDVLPEIITELPNDLLVCDTGAPPYIFDLETNTAVVTASSPNPGDLEVSYHNSQADADADNAPIANLNTYSGTDGEVIYIRVEYLNSGCYEVLSFTLNVTGQPAINPVPDLVLCDDPSNDGVEDFDLEAQTAGILGAQSSTAFNVTYHLSFADADAGLGALTSPYPNTISPEPIFVRIESATDSNCYNASVNPVFNLIVEPREDASFVMNPTCDGATATISGDLGGTFAFNPVPGDGATIDAATGLVTGGTSGATYTVEYTTSGTCSSVSSQTFSVLEVDDASFTPTPACDGATVTINGDLGGTFAFNPISGDAAVIDGITGEVTNATPGNTYSIEYTTTGACPSSSIETFTVLDLDDPSFVLTATCDGATATISGDTGGVFSFNPDPGDGAIVDAATGTITNALPGQTYSVEYTTAGPCIQSSIESVTVLNNDDASFTITPTCDGATIVINGTPGGVFSFEVPPSDTAIIDPVTGEVTNGSPNTSYSINYTTTGVCSATEVQTFNTLPIDDPSFSVSPTCDGGLVTITGTPGGTFSFNIPPTDGAIIDPVTGAVTNGTPGETYTIEYVTSGVCPDSSSVQFSAFPLPTAVVPTPLEVCDDGVPDGITEIDLSLKDVEVSGGNGSYVVTYHEAQAEADLGQNALPVPYTNLANNQVVIARVEDPSTGCYATVPLELVVQQAPVAFAPSPLVFCDPDSDGFGSFDLTLADNEITGGDATLSVTYHETQANAGNGVDAIDATVPYSNIAQDSQTLYARVESPTVATDCATVVELQLIVEPTPQPGTPQPLEECDDASADGLAQFDLTAAAAGILDGLDPAQYILSYYETAAAADAGAPAIAVPTAYTNTVAGGQTVWVRIDDTATLGGCYAVAELELVVNPLPVLAVPPPLSLCDALTPGDGQEPFDLTDADASILGGQNGIVLTYHETQADADAGTAAITGPYTNTVNAQTVYVRGEDVATGCYSTVTLTLRVDPVPSPEPDPDPIAVCDDDNDGFAEFDLEVRTVEITNGEADVTITYHETLEDAQQGGNPIVGPYTNIVPGSQQVYVRAENDITGCFSLTLDTLELIVVPSPEVPDDLPPLVRCDDDGDGITQFDLTEMDALVLGAQDPAQLELSYHTGAADAATGANPIANIGNYTNTSNPQVVYVRLYDPATDCLDTGEFELRVDLPPVAQQPAPLELCDDLGEPGDEVTVFDLTVKDVEITGGNASWTVAYYETAADAQAQTGAVPDPTQYTNTSVGGLPANPQTLYVVVTDGDTGCVDFATLTIRVLPNPTPTPSDLLPDLVLCDDVNTGDGVETFDLTQNEALLLNGEAGVTPTYHTSAVDADSGANAIPDPTAHVNTASPLEDIYVRVENDVTGCYTVVEFSIVVNPLPEVVAVTDFIQCELGTDGFAQFDLTQKDAEVLGGQDPGSYTVSYHETLADAEALANGITGLYTNTSNPQEIYVAITDNVTGCSVATQRFDLEVQEAAQANPGMEPLVYPLCDDGVETDGDPSNDSVQFQLSSLDGEVLDGQDPAAYTVSYYATQQDAELFVNPLPDLYENVSNPQVIYVRVDNDTPGGMGQDSSICFDVAAVELRVDPLPVIGLEDSYLLCVGTDGSEVVDVPVLDTGLSAADHTFEWSLDGQVLAGETGPSLVPMQGGTYTVRAENVLTGCFDERSTEVGESGPPSLVADLVTEAFSEGNVIEALATGDGVYEYSLDGGPWQEEGVFTDVRPGIRVVYARDVNGCGVASVEVAVIDYPRFFTPNGDGNNDTWNIIGLGGQPNAKIYIFDRYGKLLKQLAPNGAGWDGTFNGNRMPTSDYWFTLAYQEPLTGEPREFRAHFTLKR